MYSCSLNPSQHDQSYNKASLVSAIVNVLIARQGLVETGSFASSITSARATLLTIGSGKKVVKVLWYALHVLKKVMSDGPFVAICGRRP